MKPWTTYEVRFLRENAGVIPLDEIQQELRRSASSVRSKASELGLSLEVPEWPLEWCDRCATWRTSVSRKTDWCLVCMVKELRERSEAKHHELLSSLPQDLRDEWLEVADRGTGKAIEGEPLPSAPDLRGLNHVERAERQVSYLRELENVQLKREQRRWDAARARLSRLKKFKERRTKK